MIVIQIDDIKLKSLNQGYRFNRKTGRMYINKDYRQFKDEITKLTNLNARDLKPPYQVSIEFESYLDIDNPIKAILDGIEDSEVIKNDKDILRLFVIKRHIPRGRPGKLKITVESIKEE